MGLESVEGGVTLRGEALGTKVTSTKTVAVFTKPGGRAPDAELGGTTCTVRGRVLLCITGAGALLLVGGLRLSVKSASRTSATLAVAVMLPELSRPVMTSVKGCAPLKPAGAVVGANTVKLTVPLGPKGRGSNFALISLIWAWAVNSMELLKPPMGTTSKVPLTDPFNGKSVLKTRRFRIWTEG